jgi:hypothetical protein
MSEKNKKTEKNVALLELGGSHAECLHTQIHYLALSGYKVHLICDTRTWSQIEEKHLITNSQVHTIRKGVFHQLALLFKIHRYIRKRRISHLVFNTTEIKIIRNLFLIPFPEKLNLTGILHNAIKLSGRGMRNIIGKRMSKFFLLSEYLREKYQPLTDFRLATFYPVYFPSLTVCPIEKPSDEFWIAIPGGVVAERRDYVGLLTALLKEILHPKIKLFMLGHHCYGSFPEIDELMMQTRSKGIPIVNFTTFVEYEKFHGYIVQCDLIMPLIHPGKDNKNEFYQDARISGSFNLSFAYKIPLLVEESMQKWTDLQGASFYYKAENIVQAINSFAEQKPAVEQMRETMAKDCRWKVEHLMQQYLDFIEL